MPSQQYAETFCPDKTSRDVPEVAHTGSARSSVVSPGAVLGGVHGTVAPDHPENDCKDSEFHGAFLKSAEAPTYETVEGK